jgi:chromosome segregation protein
MVDKTGFDGWLDPVAYERFSAAFKEVHAKRAQFVVISHNDTTIQAADCVYGVSKEDGESKLVGIKLPE